MSQSDTVFVLVTDVQYFQRCKRTIIDLRTIGNWKGDIVIIAIDFDVNKTFLDFYQIEQKRFPTISEKYDLCNKLLHFTPFSDTIDGREISKVNQWEKLHVFDEYFKKWSRVVFLDAGLRVLHDVHSSILMLQYKDHFLAPDDGGNYIILPNKDKLFKTQVSKSFYKRLHDTLDQFGGEAILEECYFLNCIWVYDTSILSIVSKNEMIEGILKHPVCKTNEMALMNLYIHFKYGLWKRFPPKIGDKILFDWSELNNPLPSTWREYCFIKYPCTISFEDT
jgi:hypothetical protein